uniref:Protein with signal anchor n=1 Tax=Anopheles marajoara TaxID=58244 RepID=A0A2M4C3G5_9DIPT
MCKVLCMLIAVSNFLAMPATIYAIMQHTDEQPLLEVFYSPCLGNMVLAVLLMIGLIMEELSLVRLFKIFFYAQLVFALLMVVYGHRLFDIPKRPSTVKIFFSIMFVVCGIELVIVSASLESMRKKLNPSDGVVVYMPAAQCAPV